MKGLSALTLCLIFTAGLWAQDATASHFYFAGPLNKLTAEGVKIDDVLGEVERRFILQALERSGGVRTNAARLLGITLRSLRYRMQKHAMNDEDDVPISESSPPDSV